MKFYYTILFFILSFSTLVAQEVLPFKIGLQYAPEMGYIILGTENINSPADLSETSSFRTGFVTGLSFEYNIGRGFALQSGILLGRRKYVHTIGDIRFAYDVTNGTSSRIDSDMSIKTVEVPILLKYYIVQKKFNLWAAAGITYNKPTSATADIVATYGDGVEENYGKPALKIKYSIYSLIFSLGGEYQINDKFSISLEPTFRYNPSKITLYLYQSESEAIYNIGATIGVHFAFGQPKSTKTE